MIYISHNFKGGAFGEYSKLLIEWNKKFNLTAVTDPEQIIIKHFKDSLYCSDFIPKGSTVVDVGSGAGFPGIPLKIVRPDISLTLMDSLRKRVNFLMHVCSKLNITADCVHIRAEDAGRSVKYRERFDIAVSRAVAKLPVLAEYCLPLVRQGGAMLAMKSTNIKEELCNAEGLIKKLGGGKLRLNNYTIDGSDIKHCIIEVFKAKATPDCYPRRANKVGGQ